MTIDEVTDIYSDDEGKYSDPNESELHFNTSKDGEPELTTSVELAEELFKGAKVMETPPSPDMDSSLPERPTFVEGSGTSLTEQLFGGIKVSGERPLIKQDESESFEPPKGKREASRERSAYLNEMAEYFFTDSEKEKWDHDFRRFLLVYMDYGYIDFYKDPEKDSRTVVFNVSKVKEDGYIPWEHSIRVEAGDFSFNKVNRSGKSSQRRPRDCFEVFAEMSSLLGPVYSDSDYEKIMQGFEVKPKDLIYLPKSDPLDIESVKSSDFHLGLWEVRNTMYSLDYPTESGVSYNTNEVSVMALVFNKNYGNGERNKDGILEVTYSDGTRRGISGDFFRSYRYYGSKTSTRNVSIYDSPRGFLSDECPGVVESGHIKLEDFRARSGWDEGQEGYFTNSRLVGREIYLKGRVMVDGVAYWLGSEFYNKSENDNKANFSVHKISPEYACVVKEIKRGSRVNRYEVTHVFRLLNDSEKQEYNKGEKYPRVNKSDLSDIGFWNVADFVEENPDYINVIENWKEFLDFSNLLEKSGTSIVNLSLREQSKIWEIFSQKSNRGLKKFIMQKNISNSSKESRLKSIITVSESTTNLDKVVELGNMPNSQFLFDNLSSISDTVNSYEKQIMGSGEFSDLQIEKIRQINNMVLKHATRLFLSASEVLKDKDISVQDVLNILYRYNRDVELWYQSQFSRKSNSDDNKYLKLLELFDRKDGNENMQTLLLSMIEEYWVKDILDEAKYGGRYSVDTMNRIRDFYKDNDELFNTSSETTGDTEKELSMLGEFFQRLVR